MATRASTRSANTSQTPSDPVRRCQHESPSRLCWRATAASRSSVSCDSRGLRIALGARTPGAPSGGTPNHPAFLSVDGRTFANPIAEGDGDAQIAVEYAYRSAGWVLVDGTITETGFCGALGASALANYRRTAGPAGGEPGWARATPAEVAALEEAAAGAPGRFNNGSWSVQRASGGVLAQWIDEGEGPQPSGVLLFEGGGAWRPLISPAPNGSAFRVSRRGRYVMVVADSSTVPARVYDLRDGQLVWTQTTGEAPGWSPR